MISQYMRERVSQYMRESQSMSLLTRIIWGHIIIVHHHDITVNERGCVTVDTGECV